MLEFIRYIFQIIVCIRFKQCGGIVIYTCSALLLVLLPDDVRPIILSRTIAGVGHGLVYLISVIYGGEIASKRIRGMLLNMLNFGQTVGLTIFTIVNMLQVEQRNVNTNITVGIITLSACLVCLSISWYTLLESPVYLVANQQDDEAIENMKKFRNEHIETSEHRLEIQEFKALIASDMHLSETLSQDDNMRILIILNKLTYVSTFNIALNMIKMVYLGIIFNRYFDHRYNWAPLTLMGFKLMGAIAFYFVVDKVARKTQYVFTTISSGCSLIFVGLLISAFQHVNLTPWIPALVFVIFEVVSAFGIGSFSDIFMSEGFTNKRKKKFIAVSIIIENVLHCLLIVIATQSEMTIVYVGTILLTSGFLILLLTIPIALFLPETRNKTLWEVRDACKFLNRV